MNKIEKNIENKNPNDLTQVKVGVGVQTQVELGDGTDSCRGGGTGLGRVIINKIQKIKKIRTQT